MKYKEFGTTGMKVSEIGFGGSRIGGVFADKHSSSNDALNVLRKALTSGITFYDTADIYAQGESESLIGSAFHGCRERVFLATKGGFCLPARRNMIKRFKPLLRPIVQTLGLRGTSRLRSAMGGTLSQDFSRVHLTRALEASLRRLRTDYVDLYQLHSPPIPFIQSAHFTEALDTLERLRVQGKLRLYGVATEDPDDAIACITAPGISSIQLGFGLLDLQAIDQGTLEAATSRGLAVIARGCFAGGFLSGGIDDDRLKVMTPKWRQILRLRSVCSGMGRSVLETALQFCLATPAISVTLLGMRMQSHLEQNLRYTDSRPLTLDEYVALRRNNHS